MPGFILHPKIWILMDQFLLPLKQQSKYTRGDFILFNLSNSHNVIIDEQARANVPT